MTYIARLLCLCLACFFLVNLGIGLLLRLLAPAIIGRAERLKPLWAARLLFAVRLLPLVFGLFTAAAICVPSYLRWEPQGIAEPIGLGCLLAAGLCVAAFALSISRALRALIHSYRYTQRCRRIARQARLPGAAAPVLIVQDTTPCFALTGIFRPRLVIAPEILQTLSPEQLSVSLQHERAHQSSHDNLKRLVLLIAPGMLPFYGGFKAIERAWAKFAEWAADDSASVGNSLRALSLAEALIRVSRLGLTPQAVPLTTSLLASNDDLSARVERLLCTTAPAHRMPLAAISVTSVAAGLLLAFAFLAPRLLSVHEAFEYLIR